MKHTKHQRQLYGQIASESRLIALMGLNQAAFTALSRSFEAHWQGLYQRVSPKATDVLPSIDDRVFFLLKYLRTNPLQEELAHDFAMSQPQANMWIHALLPVFQTTLRSMNLAPLRGQAKRLQRYWNNTSMFFLMGAERPIHRPSDTTQEKAS